MLSNIVEAERAVLAYTIFYPDDYDKVSSWIPTASVFWDKRHRVLWESITQLINTRSPIDEITLAEICRLKDLDFPIDYIDSLMSIKDHLDPDKIEQYSKIVWRNNIRREAVSIARRFEDVSQMDEEEIEDLLIQEQRYIEELIALQPARDASFDKISDVAVDNIVTGSRIIRLNLPYMDNFAGGITRGELVALGGRPGNGKTTIILNIVDALARQGLKVLLFNREMTNTMAIARLIVMNSDLLRNEHLRESELEPWMVDEIKRINAQLKETYKTVRMYDDIRDLSGAVREILRWKPDVFIDDYIQLVQVRENTRKDRRFDIEKIMMDYKWAAKKVNASGILVSQLNREVEKRDGNRPSMGDFAEGGTIEQMSEMCAFINYPYSRNPAMNSPYEAEVLALKVRYGKAGGYIIGYNGSKNRYYEKVSEARTDDENNLKLIEEITKSYAEKN